VDSSTITSSFSGGQGIGKDYRLYYSLIAFSGSINANTSVETNLTEEDIQLLDEAMIKAIPLARTRTKIGQYPRLYLRIELNGKDKFLKDLRSMIKVKSFIPSIAQNLRLIRKPEDYELDISALINYLNQNKDKINIIHYWKDEEISIPDFDKIFIQEDWKHKLPY
jgi:CRISPR-associated protein Csh2